MGIVYCAENIVNGYKYIGITVQSLELRRKGHLSAAFNPKNIGYNRPFMTALRNNSNEFKWYVIQETVSTKELKYLEKKYISLYRTYIGFDDCKGYNATLGGDGCYVLGDKIYRMNSSDYSIKKIYNSVKDVYNEFNTKSNVIACCCGARPTAAGDVWYYKENFDTMPKEDIVKDIDYRTNKIYLINKNKEILKKFMGINEVLQQFDYSFVFFKNGKNGLCFAQDYYKHIFDKGLYFVEKPILQYDLQGNVLNFFISIREASRVTGVKRPSIRAVCNYEKITAGGFQWRYIEDTSNVVSVKSGRDNVIHKVSQFDTQGNYICTFESLTEASKVTGIDVSSISKVCRGIKQTAGGFRWSYGESKKKLDSLKIYENNQKKAVCFINEIGKKIIFESINDASRRTGYSSSYVSKQCKNKKSNWFFI